ncbi:MAG: helix-turn-helix domain-containing protein [Ruminococcaceae bacterium]|nr:helix-turn-helix domain-containing protein [Oscillospiraceae bacterium]
MDKVLLYNVGYGSSWKTIDIKHSDAFPSQIYNYHKHRFYEINLISSGNTKILLKDQFDEGETLKIVLTPPDTPHYISCSPDTVYSRTYLRFAENFVANYIPEWKQLSEVFSENGRIITLSEEEALELLRLIEQIEREESMLGQRLLVYYVLLRLHERSNEEIGQNQKPSYVWEAMTFMENHYSEKIDFSALAKELCVGRTKLMTGFKLYTGDTMGEYLCKCRLKNAIQYLLQAETIEYAAEKCGFSDSSSLIRAFKRIYGMPPHKYVKRLEIHALE